MSARRDLILTKEDLELKVASRALIRAAGGTDGAGETVGARQQRMSDCQCRNTGDFLRIDEVGRLEDVTVSQPAWPHVTRLLAYRQGFLLVPRAGGGGSERGSFSEHLGCIAVESADTIRLLADQVTRAAAMKPNELDLVLRQARELEEAAARLVHALRTDGGVAPRDTDTS